MPHLARLEVTHESCRRSHMNDNLVLNRSDNGVAVEFSAKPLPLPHVAGNVNRRQDPRSPSALPSEELGNIGAATERGLAAQGLHAVAVWNTQRRTGPSTSCSSPGTWGETRSIEVDRGPVGTHSEEFTHP